MESVITGQALVAVLIVALALCVWRLRQRIGDMMMQVAPAGALMTAGGMAPGTAVPARALMALDGSSVTVGGVTPRPTLLLFVSASCPISAKLISIAHAVAFAERVDLLFLGDDAAAVQRDFAHLHHIVPERFVNDTEIGRVFGIDKLPYAALMETDGTLIARGLVNSREHLESLMVARETGYTTVQSYLDARSAHSRTLAA
ncbi:hypothetical protein AA103196_1711 [Ameyamaea chiangmaiensis NBRC 103196]|uniref:Methylamine utilization protein MauD n=1 Tax=Ameyamaea chiangmaiensis TaxID=442969 RepID=A0A850PBV3_9PROT|nr:methylamine utilization protein MauD [Ameyamaea chiangmaiensis]MBS4074022.1 methylamine utilization protein MauD [Ameyamaea chiangmaiensis]NVN39422.1 methylamine utilization protein MauD [Ameyamaea chiangmaiensis]GBQ67571.1 hypothetical protein AA103196_1711 [Ameyamaea chiangmaiensis NBRC 103196]